MLSVLSHDELGPSPRTVGGILHTLKHRATTFDSQVTSQAIAFERWFRY
jgi:hypothetical protein